MELDLLYNKKLEHDLIYKNYKWLVVSRNYKTKGSENCKFIRHDKNGGKKKEEEVWFV